MKKIRTAILGIAAVLSTTLIHGVPSKAAWEDFHLNAGISLQNGTEVNFDGEKVTVSATDGDNSKITGIYINDGDYKNGGIVIEGTVNEDGSRSYEIPEEWMESFRSYDIFGWTDTTYVVNGTGM
ncbi:MAG: hypothetical protein V8S96_07985 [Lachnospiraceae bacterium]